MIIIDSLLQKRADENNPIVVGMVGAGAMAKGVALQLIKYCPGFHLGAVSNRTISAAEDLYRQAGVNSLQYPDSQSELDSAIERGNFSVVDDPSLLCRSAHIDVCLLYTSPSPRDA